MEPPFCQPKQPPGVCRLAAVALLRYGHPVNRRSTRLADRARSRSTAAREAEWVEFLAECGECLRDVLGAPSAANADRRLKECQAKLEDYTQRVFQAVGGR
jgi:ChrB-like protein